MSIIAMEYRKLKSEVSEMLNTLGKIDITPEILVMIDYAYHNTDDNYEDGLSFLDRLYKKLSTCFLIRWNVTKLKKMVRDSTNPTVTFMDILNEILTDDMIYYYAMYQDKWIQL